jgi:hypothetical protein
MDDVRAGAGIGQCCILSRPYFIWQKLAVMAHGT